MTRKAGGAGTIVSVNTSLKKGQIKRPVASVEICAGRGIEGDAHQDFGHRQVSLLAIEDIEAQKERVGGAAGRRARPGRLRREPDDARHRPRRACHR